MTLARIYQPTKNAMQSGKAKNDWLLEYIPETPYFTDPLMGWTGMEGTVREIKLEFATQAEAEAYAQKEGIVYELLLPNPKAQLKKAYADNFAFNKINV